jgi:GNAT superfamily N-acetyltransferase
MISREVFPFMDVLVREARLDDAELIAALTRAAWAAKICASSEGQFETTDNVRQHLQQGGGFVLFADDAPVGSTRWLPTDENSSVWEIVRLGVIPEYRGHGLSQHLVEAVVHQALAYDIDELRVAVDSDQTRLVDLYAAHRFDVAMELEYSDAQSLEPAPTVMRRLLR